MTEIVEKQGKTSSGDDDDDNGKASIGDGFLERIVLSLLATVSIVGDLYGCLFLFCKGNRVILTPRNGYSPHHGGMKFNSGVGGGGVMITLWQE